MGIVKLTRNNLVSDLKSYGEDVLSMKVENISDDDLNKIQMLAFDYMIKMPIGTAKASALAAVEVMEGAARELKRKRRILAGK